MPENIEVNKDKLKLELEEIHGTSANPKKDELFRIAWKYAQEDYEDVTFWTEFYYADLVDLIK